MISNIIAKETSSLIPHLRLKSFSLKRSKSQHLPSRPNRYNKHSFHHLSYKSCSLRSPKSCSLRSTWTWNKEVSIKWLISHRLPSKMYHLSLKSCSLKRSKSQHLPSRANSSKKHSRNCLFREKIKLNNNQNQPRLFRNGIQVKESKFFLRLFILIN